MKVAVKNNEKNNNVSYVGNPFIKMIENKLNDDSNNYCKECVPTH